MLVITGIKKLLEFPISLGYLQPRSALPHGHNMTTAATLKEKTKMHSIENW